MSEDLLDIANLIAAFPSCFFLHHECRRPLKIGILADLAPLVSCSEEELKAVLNKYVRSDGYLLACTEGAPRIDLEGNAVDTVSAKHAAHAQKVLAERERWRLKKKAARERQQPKKAADKERTARQSARCCTRAAARAATHTTAANTKAG